MAKRESKKLKLSEELELSLLKSISEGFTTPSTLSPDELSRVGRGVLSAVKHLLTHGAKTPLDPSAIYLASKSTSGVDRKVLQKYLRKLGNLKLSENAISIIQLAKDKEALVNLLNEVGSQLSNGLPDFIKLSSVIGDRSNGAHRKIKALSHYVKDEFPDPPHGPRIKSLPTISQTANGVGGIWAIGGDPGVGKSTFAWQIAAEMNAKMQTLYYDLDGTGLPWFIDRARQIAGGSKRKFKEQTNNIYVRNGIGTLDTDLMIMKPPCLIVCDSLQTLPTNLFHRRSSLDKWLIDFKEIAKRGYSVLLVSEVGRDSYGEPSLDAFKESGEIEYACSYGAILVGDAEEEDEPIEFFIVKNRHNKKKGHVTDLVRDKDKTFWFNES